MDKGLKQLVAEYVEKIGVDKATGASFHFFKMSIVSSRDLESTAKSIAEIKFHAAVIEYLHTIDGEVDIATIEMAKKATDDTK